MDPLRKVAPGEPLTIPAAAYNAFIDVARAYRCQGPATPQPHPISARPHRITIRNATQNPIPHYGILRPETPIVAPQDNLPTFQSRIAFDGTQPQPNLPFAVVTAPLAPGAIGDAVISGPAVAKVYFPRRGTTRQYADIEPGRTDRLYARPTGAATILWAEDGEGERWAVIHIGPHPRRLYRFTLIQAMDKDTGDVSYARFHEWTANGWTYDPDTADVIPVADVHGLGFYAVGGTVGLAEVVLGLTWNDAHYPELGAVIDLRC